MFFSDEVGVEFVSFGFLHILLFLIVIGGVLLIYFMRDQIRNWKYERKLAIGMATFALLWEIGLYAWKIGNGIWTWDDGLPLSLCGMTLYIAIFAMFLKKKGLFEIGYYWTWGAIASVLFPDIMYSYDRFRFYQFMFGHMFFFFLYMYMIFVYKWHPTWKSWKKSVITLGIVTAILTIASNAAEVNLMFMLRPDDTPLSILDFGNYPLYVLLVVLTAFAIMTLWHVPWIFINKKQKS